MSTRKIRAKCRTCKHLYSTVGKKEPCFFNPTSKLYTGSCASYKKGKPFIPVVDGRVAKLISFDETKPTTFVFYTSDFNVLVLSWSINAAKEGQWHLRQVGLLPEGGIATKEFQKDDVQAAFCGSVSVVGPGITDLFTSFNFLDEDNYDEEGNLVNKPREVIIKPEKLTTKRRTGKVS